MSEQSATDGALMNATEKTITRLVQKPHDSVQLQLLVIEGKLDLFAENEALIWERIDDIQLIRALAIQRNIMDSIRADLLTVWDKHSLK